MRAINLENLKRLKKALQKKKLRRIDTLRIQVGRCDYEREPLSYSYTQNIQQELI